jgi:hypothetical protein
MNNSSAPPATPEKKTAAPLARAHCPHCHTATKLSALTALKTFYTCPTCQNTSKTKTTPTLLKTIITAPIPALLVCLTVGPTIRTLKTWGVHTHLVWVWLPLFLIWFALITWSILAMISYSKTLEKIP